MSIRRHDRELEQDEAEPCFVDDDPNGGCIIQCGGCGCEQLLKPQCKQCKDFFVIRSWWSW